MNDILGNKALIVNQKMEEWREIDAGVNFKMDWDGEFYKKHAIVQEKKARGLIESVHFHGNERVLDIGCGDGKITANIASKVPNGRVTGIDISKAMIKEALSDFGDVPNLDFFEMSAEEFAFSEKFDLIVSFTALHWVRDHQKMLERTKASLNPGGRILFSMTYGEIDPRLEKVLMSQPWKECFQEAIYNRYTRVGKSDYEKLFSDAQLQKKRIEVVSYSYTFKKREALENQFMTWVPAVMGLSTEKSRLLSAELAEAIAEGKEEQIVYTNEMLIAEASLPVQD